MSVPLPTDTFVVTTPGSPASGPVAGHASLTRVSRTDGATPAGIGQEAAFTILLDPTDAAGAAVVLSEESLVTSSGGDKYRVDTALRRPGASPSMDHWTVQARRTTNAVARDQGVDADGNVLRVP